MASIKVKFRASSVEGSEGTVYYQIIHRRKAVQLMSGYRIFPSEWNGICPAPASGCMESRRSFVSAVREQIKHDIALFSKIAGNLDSYGMQYSAGDIADEFRRRRREHTLFNFMESVIASLRRNGNARTAETYRSALNSFTKFRQGEDIRMELISQDTMESYESWLRKRGTVPNTVSFYARILRAVYNRAVDKGMTEDRHPFRHVYTGVEKTPKRALPLSVIRRIKLLDLSGEPNLEYARDMFMMSFYLRGMSLIDMAFLRKTDLRDGHLTYRRRKTGQQLIIGWTEEMQQILDKYPVNCSGYLLPIIRRKVANERSAYRNAGYNINRSLKKVAEMTGADIPLTLYVARHSWASAARSKGIPVSVISEGMGHDSETTTRIYLASLDTSIVDRANRLILKSI